MKTCSDRVRVYRTGRVLACLLSVAACAASGHDFLLWPDAAADGAVDQPIDVGFAVGHGGDYDPWPHGTRKVTRLGFVAPGGREHDVTSSVRSTGVTVTADEPGTYMLVLESDVSGSVLDAKRFDAYVADEGLGAIAAHRARTAASGSGRERYSRRAKALLQVGSRRDAAVATADYGLTLELVPLVHPLALAEGERLPVEVRYRGEALPGARVTAESLSQPALGEIAAVSDADGHVRLAIPRTGTWKLNVVWGVPSADEDVYDTVFSSLTFGYPGPGAD